MKKILSIIAVSAITTFAHSQSIGQNADGKSTVVVDSTSLGFDITQTSLNFSFNNYRGHATSRNSFLYGTQITGKNAGGITDLFKTGNIVPKSNLTVLLGGSFSNRTTPYPSQDYNNISANYQLKLAHYDSLRTEIADAANLEGVRELFKANPLGQEKELIDALKEKATSVATKPEEKVEYSKAAINLESIFNKYYGEIERLEKEMDEMDSAEVLKRFHRFVVYTDFGLNASSFKLMSTPDTTDFNNSFKTEKFRGGFVGIGMNYQCGGRFIFGAKYSYIESNTFDELDAFSYKLVTSDTNASQIITTEKTIEAYSGDYKKIATHEFSTDILFMQPAGDSSVFAFDLYTKYNQRANDTIRSLNVGLSWFVFKPTGKFMGGLYVEAPDVLNQLEEDKKPIDQRDLINRFSFGVVARFSITSMGEYFYGK